MDANRPFRKRTLILWLYFVFTIIPIYWLLNMSFRDSTETLSVFALVPVNFTLDNYIRIFTEYSWLRQFLNSLIYVILNTVLSVAAALPAAYAFSRYRFLGDKHLFFWLLTNRMAPPAVFALPFFQLYSAINLFDTHIAAGMLEPAEAGSAREFIESLEAELRKRLTADFSLAAPANGQRMYQANHPSDACPVGFGDEEVIRQIWSKR